MIEHDRKEPTPPARVVILGGSGFVGRSVTRHLTETGVATLPLSSADVDLVEPESVAALVRLVEPTDSLVFVSALTPDRGRDIRTMMKNLAMGEHVSSFLERSRVAHAVYLSSDAVYADELSLVRESSCCEPSTYYGLMHLVRERMMTDTLRGTGTPLLIVRPTILYGPEDTHNSYGPNRFFRMARADGKIVLFGEGEEKRDHVYIEDVGRLMAECLARRSHGTLNVATGRSVPFMEVARSIAELHGPGVEVEGLPRQTPITHRHFDTAAFIKAFPSFVYTPMEAGLARTWGAIAG